MSSSHARNIDVLIQQLREAGFTVEKGGHSWKVFPPGSRKWVTTLPQTPSDYRVMQNIYARLKRDTGFIPREKKK